MNSTTKTLTCDHCTRTITELVYRLTSNLAERSICEHCYNRSYAYYSMHLLRTVWVDDLLNEQIEEA